jgi:hypothetical protein
LEVSDGNSLPKPEKRKPLTRFQFATLILKQEGKCGCGCGMKLQADRIIDEHIQPLDALGSNDLSNRALFSLDCAKRKTQVDRAARDKGRRIRGETKTGPKRKIVSRNTFQDRPSPLFKLRRSESPDGAGVPKRSWGKRSMGSARKWPVKT